jgi:ATP-dependent Clp protease adaptor protein ClpS
MLIRNDPHHGPRGTRPMPFDRIGQASSPRPGAIGADAPDSEGPSTAVVEPPTETKPEPPKSDAKRSTRPAPPKMDKMPPFKVLLHNDDVNDMLHVVHTIIELTPLDKTRAIMAMAEAHRTGVSLLLVTHKERAELYADQFKSKGLIVTCEPAA